ncbi:hypothetical protein QEJ31_07270 [Pigmentibacter sp. JX0631]|uniref:hypothetical protein n=1 Tax=Pigmentibacter sp. JX0631 TaxID=2976982 RepID=UPI002468FBA1|nr:hypothetical protein [Pigmentibacter sp. JX0631]WGL61390.1 hypothetical protein QEJ31_07270 [Pigmentibacter sp. JX0631]
MKIKKTLRNFFCVLNIFIIFSFLACSKRPLPPKIGNNISFPGKLVALDSTHFLLLNTVANNAYRDGSIQLYSVDSSTGAYTLMNSLSIPTHASDIAVAKDKKLVAVSFDGTYKTTNILFYNYSNLNNPTAISNLTLTLDNAGGKQAVKNLNFFQRNSDTNHYVYGTINSFTNDDGTNGNIPARTFLAQVDQNYTNTNLLMMLSYGVNDKKSLAPKSDSLLTNNGNNGVQYTFGYSAPTYVGGSLDLFVAFPTGSMGGYSSGSNTFPYLPDALTYFSAAGNTRATCNGSPCTTTSDLRTVSMAVVNMPELLAGVGVNNSTYFVPLAWNQNVMPYNSLTNGKTIKAPNNTSDSDLNSFAFQTNFWSSYWANTTNNGNGVSSCYTSTATAVNNQNSILGDNTLFVVKNGTNGANDLSADGGKGGLGNEVIGISGLDILQSNIVTDIKPARTSAAITTGETDFKSIANYQVIDINNKVTTFTVKPWINQQGSNLQNKGPLSPFIYSRTTNAQNAAENNLFDSTPSGILNLGVLNFGGNTCRPYWARSTNMVGAMGRETSWLTANPYTFTSASRYYNIFPNLLQSADPTKLSVYSFKPGSGSQSCVDLNPTANKPKVFCANFLTSDLSKFSVSQSDPVFTSY